MGVVDGGCVWYMASMGCCSGGCVVRHQVGVVDGDCVVYSCICLTCNTTAITV